MLNHVFLTKGVDWVCHFLFLLKGHKSTSGLQITDHSCDITNCKYLTRGIAGLNFNFIPCIELEVYTQRANLCLTLKKIVNLSLCEIGTGRVHQNILCVSACICSNNALRLLVEQNRKPGAIIPALIHHSLIPIQFERLHVSLSSTRS